MEQVVSRLIDPLVLLIILIVFPFPTAICAAKCPSQCIAVDKKHAMWQCDPFACIYRGICVDSCKTDSLRQELQYRPATVEREHILLRGVVAKKEGKRMVRVNRPKVQTAATNESSGLKSSDEP